MNNKRKKIIIFSAVGLAAVSAAVLLIFMSCKRMGGIAQISRAARCNRIVDTALAAMRDGDFAAFADYANGIDVGRINRINRNDEISKAVYSKLTYKTLDTVEESDGTVKVTLDITMPDGADAMNRYSELLAEYAPGELHKAYIDRAEEEPESETADSDAQTSETPSPEPTLSPEPVEMCIDAVIDEIEDSSVRTVTKTVTVTVVEQQEQMMIDVNNKEFYDFILSGFGY